MECTDAQRIVSERLDSEEMDATQLEAAKDHCRSCSECAAFVRTLATLRMMPLPQPPPDLTKRIMSAIAEEKAASAALPRAASPASGRQLETPATRAADEGRLSSRLKDPRNRRAVIAWSAAAATVLVIAGVSAVAGVRLILAPAPTKSYEVESLESGVVQEEFGPETSTMQDSTMGSPAADGAPSYITVGTSVYLLGGQESSVATASLTAVGTTTSSLGGTQVTQHTVLSAGDPATVYITPAGEGVLAFTRVTREFGGRTYALSGGPITEYGKWPTLPPGFKTPTSADGSPEFVAAGTDSDGVPVFRRRGGTTADGIAVPPGSAADDPAAGSPNWTWWEPFTP